MKTLSSKSFGYTINLLSCFILTNACTRPFEGFGIYLGRFWKLNSTELIESVLKLVYDDLGLRLFRTEYLHQFSLQEDQVEIKCIDDTSCTWIDIHRIVAKNFKDVKVFASVWSAPKYMLLKIPFTNIILLKLWKNKKYAHYLRTVTDLISKQFGINIEKVSVVNEPDGPVEWDHMNIEPFQLAEVVKKFEDKRYHICPETVWFPTLKIYLANEGLYQQCDILLTHSYGWHETPKGLMDVIMDKKSPNVSYDMTKRDNEWLKPMWMTETSAPGKKGDENILEEAIDFAKNIINYVGFTCVTRYYYWLAYTMNPSGESLVWGNLKGKIGDKVEKNSDRFRLPKKYFVYRHFSHSSMPLGKRIADLCFTKKPIHCLNFDDNYVFVNDDHSRDFKAPISMPLCCTTRSVDYQCNFTSDSIPPQSICSSVDAKK